MPDILSSSNYYCYSIDYTGNWPATRDATASDSVTNWQNGHPQVVMVIRDSGRGGGTYVVVRAFIKFGTIGISSGDVGTAHLKFTTRNYATLGRMIAVKGTADGSGTADFDAIEGFSAGDSMDGNVTDYSSTIDPGSASVGSTFELELNASCISDMENNNSIVICLVSYDWDYKNEIPTTNPTFARVGIRGKNQSDPPTLTWTAAGYGNSISGISNNKVGAVDGILTANISTVIGV